MVLIDVLTSAGTAFLASLVEFVEALTGFALLLAWTCTRQVLRRS